MRRKWIVVAAVLGGLSMAAVAAAEDRSGRWEEVRKARAGGLPRSAIEALEPIVRGAIADRAWPEAVRALAERVALEASLEGPGAEAKIRRLESELGRAPAPMRPLLEVVLAEAYREYFRANRGRLLRRSPTTGAPGDDLATWDLPRVYAAIDLHLRRALAARETLARIPIGQYDALLPPGRTPDAYRPTLFDFVAFQALEFYTSPEQAGARPEDAFEIDARGPIFASVEDFLGWQPEATDSTSPALRAVRLFQEVLRFHAGDADRGAFLDADLARLTFGWRVAFGDARDSLYLAALERLAERDPDHELAARAHAARAMVLEQQGDFDAAHEAARRGVERFPGTTGGNECASIVRRIEAPVLSIGTERVWNDAGPSIAVRSRNLPRVHFRIVRLTPAEEQLPQHDLLRRWHGDDLGGLLARPAERSWAQALHASADFAVRTEEFPAPLEDLAPGVFVLVASEAPDPFRAAALQFTLFWVSDLALVVRSGSSGELEGLVLDARDGHPRPRSRVRSWSRSDQDTWRPERSTRTDGGGRFRIAGDARGTHLLATQGDHRLSGQHPIGSPGPEFERVRMRTVLFTDRVIYRPGQTVRYKGICIHVEETRDDYSVLPGAIATVVFRDASGNEVARREHAANDQGSFSGSFTAPADRLRGEMAITVVAGPPGAAGFRVEEYKRPKFHVALDSPRDPVRSGERVEVAGRATAYTGAPVGGALVRWRVVRHATWEPWRKAGTGRSWPPHGREQEVARGTVRSEADGGFRLIFVAEPDRRLEAATRPVHRFEVHADVTDLAGETRSASGAVHVGAAAFAAELTADEWQTNRHPVVISVRTSSLSGRPAPETGTLTVHALREPEQVGRARLAGEPPPTDLDAYDPALPGTWPDRTVVFESRVATDSLGATKLEVPLAAGAYRARYEARDRFGTPVSAELTLIVLDPEAARCAVPVPDLLVAPTWSVEAGEEFTALWASGYEGARAHVEIEHRGRLLQRFWTPKGRSQVLIRQHVSPAMRGGFQVRVTMVHDNRAYLHEQVVQVPWTDRRLDLRWEHFVSKLEPGKPETWTAVVARKDGKPVDAEMVATLYDASLDAFRPSSWPDGFGVFRRERRRDNLRFENAHLSLYPRRSFPPPASLDPSTDYRAFPPEVVATDFTRTIPASALQVGIRQQISLQAGSALSLPRAAQAIHGRGGPAADLVPAPEASAIPAGAVEDAAVAPRRNFEETAFFLPHLRTDPRGVLRAEFTMPEALTRWRFLGFAHDEDLRAGLLEGTAVTSRDLMVEPNPPRFLRQGDQLDFTVRVTNRSAQAQSGHVRLTLTDAATGESLESLPGLRTAEQAFDVPAAESRVHAWRLTIPDGLGALTWRVVASTGRLSDGEESFLPVLSRRVLVTESLPLPLRGAGERSFDFARLRASGTSRSLRHQSLAVQMVSSPAWYAMMALPYLMEFPHDCSEQVFNRLYANALAHHVAESDPALRAVFERWRATAALDSPLEKNAGLKAAQLEATPWLHEAQEESQARRDVGILFDSNRLRAETRQLEQQLRETQLPDGAWSWFPGGRADDYITLYIVSGFGRLRHLGVAVDEAAALLALRRLDRWMTVAAAEARARGGKERNHLTPTVALYLYGRSFFLRDLPLAADARDAGEFWLEQGRRHWLALPGRKSQAHLALAFQRFGDREAARTILRSLRERAVRDDELGMHWRENGASWAWDHAPIETQAVLIEAFAEVAEDSAAVEDLKVWLLRQKQTRNWKTTKATADAVYALLLRGRNLLAPGGFVEIALGGRAIRPVAVEAGTGFYEERLAGPEVTPALARITVKKPDPGIAWGSVHWQYLEDVDRVTPHAGMPLRLTKAFFVRRSGRRGPVLEPVSGPIAVGDELVTRITLRADRDMDYVHLRDERGSGVEPVDVLSGSRFRDGLSYYAETRDAASHFFIDVLSRGTYVLEYSTRVQHRGRYASGTAQVQCMYAPEFNSHSGSTTLVVR